MKVFWVISGVLWVCVVFATVEMLVFDNPTAINGVIGGGMAAVLSTGLAVFSRGLDRP